MNRKACGGKGSRTNGTGAGCGGYQGPKVELLSKIFPKGETKPLTGEVATKEVGFVARLAANHAMEEITSDISTVPWGICCRTAIK